MASGLPYSSPVSLKPIDSLQRRQSAWQRVFYLNGDRKTLRQLVSKATGGKRK
jgi:hypothetical protein